MSSQKKTPYYNLSQFEDNDKPTWRGDYTGDMGKIDTAMHANQLAAQNAQTTATKAQTAATKAQTTADNATTTATTAKNSADAATTAAANAKSAADTAYDIASSATSMLNSMGVDSAADAADFLKHVDSIDNEATTNTACLTALNAHTASNAAALLNRINGKADTTDVYTRAQADATFATKTQALTELVWIGDSYSTGYQPAGSVEESKRIPNVCAALLGLNLHSFANNASGYVTAGDGGKTFATLASEAAALSATVRNATKYVVVCGGRNDSGGTVQSGATSVFNTLKTAFPNAVIHAIFLFDFNSLSAANAGALRSIEYASYAAGVAFHPHMWTLGMGHPDWYYNSSDIHPNANGSATLGRNCAMAIDGRGEPDGLVYETLTCKGGASGTIIVTMSGGIATIRGKFTASNVKSGTNICDIPRFIDMGDQFLYCLNNSGGGIAFLKASNGALTFTGVVGGGDLNTNCWITPQSFMPSK